MDYPMFIYQTRKNKPSVYKGLKEPFLSTHNTIFDGNCFFSYTLDLEPTSES